MSKINKKAVDTRADHSKRLAGGGGAFAASQEAPALLRRAVMANLLWEDNFYENGHSIAETICELIPQVDPDECARIAIEARTKQKLRHIPLLIAREMARLHSHRDRVSHLLTQIVLRPDEMTELLAIYLKDGKIPLSAQIKKGLAKVFGTFNAYQLAKYNRDDQIKLRDVMRLVRPKPPEGKEELFKQVRENILPTPDTWEVALSGGEDKKTAWERLLNAKKLGALAFVRNLRNMEKAGVDRELIKAYFEEVDTKWLLPLNMLAAAQAEPRWEHELQALMLRSLKDVEKLPGKSIVVIDVSGSMGSPISSRSEMSRLDAAAAMAMLAIEVCEEVEVYATGGDDYMQKHATKLLRPRHGFAMLSEIKAAKVGRGGIFTRQCLNYIKDEYRGTPDRIMIFSDSQDCDRQNSIPHPFGKNNYIIDVSAHRHGINYRGAWTAEIGGWSEHFLTFIAALEGVNLGEQENDHE